MDAIDEMSRSLEARGSTFAYKPIPESIDRTSALSHKILLQKAVAETKSLSKQEHKFTVGLRSSIVLSILMPIFSIGVIFCCIKRNKIREQRAKLARDISHAAVHLTKHTQQTDELSKTMPSQISSGKTAKIFNATARLVKISKQVSHLKTSAIKKAVAEANKDQEHVGEARDARALPGISGTWVPHGFRAPQEKDMPIVPLPETINPTSDRNFRDKGGQQHLSTVFVMTPENKHIDPRPHVITMGVPYRKNQGEELTSLIASLQKDSTSTPNRTAFHGLLTRLPSAIPIGQESHYMEGEHRNVAHISGALHTNNALNAFSDIFPSNQYNKEAYRTYVQWAMETCPLPSLEDEMENLDEVDCKKRSEAFLKIEPSTVATRRGYRTFSILDQLYNNTSLSPSTRVLLELALDRELDVTSVINCKSGQDRTGHIRSLDAVLSRLIANGELKPNKEPEQYIDFLKNLDQNLEKLNKRADEKDSPLHIKELDDPSLKKVFLLQNLYFEEMQRVALPITAMSTGIAGLKYSMEADASPLFSNPHILPFIPRFAYGSHHRPVELLRKSTSATMLQKIITAFTSKKPPARQLTHEGLHIIQGLAQSRGA